MNECMHAYTYIYTYIHIPTHTHITKIIITIVSNSNNHNNTNKKNNSIYIYTSIYIFWIFSASNFKCGARSQQWRPASALAWQRGFGILPWKLRALVLGFRVLGSLPNWFECNPWHLDSTQSCSTRCFTSLTRSARQHRCKFVRSHDMPWSYHLLMGSCKTPFKTKSPFSISC